MTSAENEYDVAIIGYGPVGVTAANLLGRLGRKVLVIERDVDIYHRARAISTDEEVIRIWQSIGLAEQLKADMLSDRPIDFVDAGGRSFMSLAATTRGNGHPPQLFIYQPALERTLRAGVERYPNVRVELGREVVSRCQDADGVELTVVGTGDDRLARVRASYVIAADGGSSPTRSQLGIGFEGRTYEDRWIVIDTKVLRAWPEVDRLRFHCNPRRPAVDCPTPLGHHRWEFPVLPGDDETELVKPAAVRRLLADQGITDEHVEVLRAVVYSHHVRFASRWRQGRIFLAGDAAHVMPPWIGEGMASGVRDAANLCWKLDAVLAGSLPESILDSYEIERQPHVRALTRAAVNLGRIITERRKVVTTLRDPILRGVTRTPVLGDAVRGGDWLPVSRYLDGLLGHGAVRGRSRRRGADGWLITQPWVLSEQGDRVRLDDALPDGWVVLRVGSRSPITAWDAAGVPSYDVLEPGATATPGAVVDVDGELAGWCAHHRVDVVVLRPDRFVYTAGDLLAPPPFAAVGRAIPVGA